MRIGIIGHPCIDEVFLHGASEPVRSLGGIFYSYAAMERLMQGSRNSFVPLTWRCESDRPLLDPFLDRLKHSDRSHGLWPTTALTNRVQLVYPEHGERTEHCPNVLPPLSTKELTPNLLSELDGLFVNMISGFDVTIDVLESAIAAAAKKPFVHLDVHALILGDLSTGEGSHGGGRTPRGVRDWKRWLAVSDSVQLNELEVRWFGDPDVTNEEQLIHYFSAEQQRPRYVIITRAAHGATLYDLKDEAVHHVPVSPTTVVNPTGAGDVFGAAFIHSIMSGSEAAIAIRNAVEWASWSTTVSTLEEILSAPKK
jgi:sugar/nucleoside kinase (ribokinase family)